MTYTLRPYQEDAVQAGIEFMLSSRKRNGVMILPTGAGKSLCLAGIATALDAPCLLFQPSKEILEQNLAKFHSYGYRPSVYSASLNRKTVGQITLATIGSVAGAKNRASKAHLFEDFPYVIVDECDLASAKSGQYKTFFNELNVKILGLTATPYRLHSDSMGTMLKFLTRTRPKIFDEVVYYVQNRLLFDEGYLAKLEYHTIRGFDRHAVRSNSTGNDFDERALQMHLFKINWQDKVVKVTERLLERGRKSILVFTRFVAEAQYVAQQLEGASLISADTPKDERAILVSEFRKGRIRVLVNVGVLTVGADFPELDTVVLARPTKSLRLIYQMIGRCIRVHPDKESSWIVDMVGATEMFGKIEDLTLYCDGKVKWAIWGKPGDTEEEIQLTNTYLNNDARGARCKRCGSNNLFWARHEKTGNSAPIARPSNGTKPNIALVPNEEGKTVYRIVPVGDSAAEFVSHYSQCQP